MGAWEKQRATRFLSRCLKVVKVFEYRANSMGSSCIFCLESSLIRGFDMIGRSVCRTASAGAALPAQLSAVTRSRFCELLLTSLRCRGWSAYCLRLPRKLCLLFPLAGTSPPASVLGHGKPTRRTRRGPCRPRGT